MPFLKDHFLHELLFYFVYQRTSLDASKYIHSNMKLPMKLEKICYK